MSACHRGASWPAARCRVGREFAFHDGCPLQQWGGPFSYAAQNPSRDAFICAFGALSQPVGVIFFRNDVGELILIGDPALKMHQQ